MAARDQHKPTPYVLLSPGSALAITPDDNADLEYVVHTIKTNVSGTVRMRAAENQAVVDEYLLAGVEYGRRIDRVYATGTDVDLGIVGWW
ncbi:spike base protein, RCAP_Rcc01079 family [Mesobacterium pallidum]|uniref:spike base protein, RCAP_Rcc01079 family n=1 Tax=Mesobacterium pallidum TaxID=2872037 RepID=UPI001EE2D4AF|nr:hypothetical protein [Mesobacterium pallidum]